MREPGARRGDAGVIVVLAQESRVPSEVHILIRG